MVAVYALVLTGLFTLVSVPCTIALFKLRAHPLIKCRNPFLLILQSIGTFVAATLLSLCIFYFVIFWDYFAILFYFIYLFNTLICETQTLLEFDSCTYLGLRPDYSCYALFTGTMLCYSHMALPLCVRVWEYCVNFHMAQLRSKFRYPLPLYSY